MSEIRNNYFYIDDEPTSLEIREIESEYRICKNKFWGRISRGVLEFDLDGHHFKFDRHELVKVPDNPKPIHKSPLILSTTYIADKEEAKEFNEKKIKFIKKYF